MTRQQKAFTLLELSIVITVIALIIGAVVIGQSMIRQAQIRGVPVEMARLIQACMDFRDKYQALPGDMSNATSFWGTDPGGCPSTPYNTTRKTTTCNGNGDGMVYNYATAAQPYEIPRLFQHLANAGMLEGAYTGAQGPAGVFDIIPGLNVPSPAISGAGYALQSSYTADTVVPTSYFPGPYGHLIFYGKKYPNDVPIYPIFTAEEAMLIDQKMDDGLPGLGNVMSYKNTSAWDPNCSTSASASTAAYNIAQSGQVCALFFKTGF